MQLQNNQKVGGLRIIYKFDVLYPETYYNLNTLYCVG